MREFRVLRFGCEGENLDKGTWRVIGTYKWGYKYLEKVKTIVTLLITLLVNLQVALNTKCPKP